MSHGEEEDRLDCVFFFEKNILKEYFLDILKISMFSKKKILFLLKLLF